MFQQRDQFLDQQEIGLREVFAGILVKSWVALPLESIKFKNITKLWLEKR